MRIRTPKMPIIGTTEPRGGGAQCWSGYIAFALLVKAAFLLLNLVGHASLWAAIAAEVAFQLRRYSSHHPRMAELQPPIEVIPEVLNPGVAKLIGIDF